jgi:hypothetical protein
VLPDFNTRDFFELWPEPPQSHRNSGSVALQHRARWVEGAMCDRDQVSSAARDRELAAECERLAELATDDNTRAYYRRLAAYYLERARSEQPCN